jgi:hypothetical protein
MDLVLTGDIIATKESQQFYADSIIRNVLEGNESALNVLAKIKFVSDALKTAGESIKRQAIDEAAKYDKNETAIVLGGYTCKLQEMGVKYDYSGCGHPRLNEITETISKLNAERKEIEEFLKTIKKSMVMADESTGGEEVTLYPPTKQSTTTPVFTFIKK